MVGVYYVRAKMFEVYVVPSFSLLVLSADMLEATDVSFASQQFSSELVFEDVAFKPSCIQLDSRKSAGLKTTDC